MGANYFTPENAWRHLFFIHGCTADEFYTDGGLKLNIEQLTQLELKRSGYERVVFYDKDQKLYCYDDESFALLRGRSGAGKESAPAPEGAAPTHRKGGLKRGKLGKKAAASAEPVQPVEAEAVPDQSEQTDGTWTPGAACGIKQAAGMAIKSWRSISRARISSRTVPSTPPISQRNGLRML